MKKHSFYIFVIAALSITYAWKHQPNYQKEKLSKIALANLEALTNNESSTGYCTMHFPCFDEYGLPTGKYSASSYTGPGCNGVYHSHYCTDCNNV